MSLGGRWFDDGSETDRVAGGLEFAVDADVVLSESAGSDDNDLDDVGMRQGLALLKQ